MVYAPPARVYPHTDDHADTFDHAYSHANTYRYSDAHEYTHAIQNAILLPIKDRRDTSDSHFRSSRNAFHPKCYSGCTDSNYSTGNGNAFAGHATTNAAGHAARTYHGNSPHYSTHRPSYRASYRACHGGAHR
jgi:hypothetical protein